MLNSSSIWSTLLVLSVIGCQPQAAQQSEPFEMLLQTATERHWIDVTEIHNYAPNLFLVRPRQFRQYDNELFLVDDRHVKRLSLNGDIINTVSLGRGDGPGEINFVSDYSVSGDNVWILDDHSRRVSHFDRSGQFKSSFPTKRVYIRISAAPSKLTLFQLDGSYPFREFTFEGEEIDSLGHHLSSQSDNPIALDGTLLSAGEDQIRFLSSYASQILTFDKTTGQTIQLIDRKPFPQMSDTPRASGNVIVRAPLASMVNRSLSIDGDSAWVLTLFRDDDELITAALLDGYTLDDGKYLGSIRLPPKSRGAVVDDASIYALLDTAIVKFEFVR